MKNGKLEAAKKVLAHHKMAVVPDAILLEALKAADKASWEQYSKNDFVAFYYGMGEMGHGKIQSISKDRYKIIAYFDGKPQDFATTVMHGDMRGLSSLEEAAEYERERSGK